jgi:hypothetical protein
MGFFDRFAGKKTAQQPTPAAANAPEPVTPATSAAGGIMPRLATAREHLELKNLPGALAIYEEVLAAAGDRADVLVTISGDLGTTGHVAEIIDLIAPRYDAKRHGPATGINLVQAYLAVRDPDAAQHVLDILFTLDRPELKERLFGFSNAIAELIHAQQTGAALPPVNSAPADAPPEHKVSLVSISKPIWFYGLEPLAEQILPPKTGRLRRIAFVQLAQPGLKDAAEVMKQPEDELGRLSRALPLWLQEAFYFSPHYAPITAIGVFSEKHYALFPAEWTIENLRQLVETTSEGLDYIVTGAIRQTSGDYEVILRVWEVKKFRERKQFTARWSPATADVELAKLHEQVRAFMEWSAEQRGLSFVPSVAPRAWLETLGASVTLFLAEKNLLAPAQVPPLDGALAQAAAAASTSETASLAFLTLRNRAERQQLAAHLDSTLANSPLIAQASSLSA